jgi:hypothetical protein
MNGRRMFIYRTLAASGLLMPLLAGAAKLAKGDVQYQDRPKDGKDCDDCMHYVRGANGAPSTCKVVDGPISPHGYCLAFTRQPKSGTGT